MTTPGEIIACRSFIHILQMNVFNIIKEEVVDN
jgi:hypothetical protein